MAQLATQATSSVVGIAEGLHQSVLATLGLPVGLSSLVYQSVRGVTHFVGKGLDAALAGLQPWLDSTGDTPPESPLRQAILAALNGVMGDHLQASHNPLAISMTLRHQGQELNWQTLRPGSPSKILVLIHGLCMNDLQWNHGALAEAGTLLYVRYNSGLHTSQNGRQLAALLEQLVTRWPSPITELDIVTHSMGGLVARSAVYYAQREGLGWPAHLRRLVFLGTPHHGAPLERIGNWVDGMLGSTPHTAPLARVGKLRSAGITDLRYGHVVDEDWQDHDRFQRKPDDRQLVPLPAGVTCYTVAASLAPAPNAGADGLIGDGLVPLPSALGQHSDSRRQLDIASDSQRIIYGMNHLELVSRPEVTLQLLRWLG